MMTRKGEKNEIIKLNTSVNEPGPSTDIQCCCRRSFASIKGMRIHHTKMGCVIRQRRKSQSEINKSIEGNQSQENYHSTQDHFVCQPNAPSVKGNYTLIGLKRMTIDGRSSMKRCLLFSEAAWEDLLAWNYILSLKLFMQFASSILELKTSKKEKNIRTANRRQREKCRLRVEQRLLKKRLK